LAEKGEKQVTIGRPIKEVTAEQRFWGNVQKSVDPGGCWWWIGGVKDDGYGTLKVNGPEVGAHRFSWEIHGGSIPEGKWVLHHCDNPRCVNPDHLFLGTHQDNMRDRSVRGRHPSSQRTHCSRGHRFDEGNTHICPKGKRVCRECGRAYWREWYARQKEKA
jgi:hypothetical protein